VSAIRHYDPKKEYFTPERCYITELLNEAGDGTCSIAQARVLPGVTTQKHALRGIAERYVILSGTGRVSIGERVDVELKPMSVVSIPAGVPQCIKNTGTEDLVFLCICTPRFAIEAYLNLESV